MGAEDRAVDPFDIPAEPELGDLLRAVMRGLKVSIRTHCPATVVAYDPVRQKATLTVGTLPVVKVTDITRLPATMVSLKGTPPNASATLAPIQLVDIPVMWPRTAAGYITFPLVTGDTGELHVHDRAIDAWLQAGIPSDPVLAATHLLSFGVFYPGFHPDTAPINPPSGTDLTATVIEGATGIKLGAAAALAAARMTDALTASANLTTWAGAVEAALSTAGSPILPASSWATLTLGAVGQLGAIATGSAKTKIE